MLTAGLVACGATLAFGAGSAAASGSGVPFTDPDARGYVALCDLAGNNVTSGKVASAPFVWRAMSSVKTPAGYGGKGQNAALTIYQPRKGVDPGEWNGDQLNGASFFRKDSPPAAGATYKDISLATIVKEYPPTWDGLYQLRMIFARKGYGDYTQTYPATVIQVTGATWHVVQGGTLPCKKAHTISNETFAGIPVLNPHPSKSQTPTSAPTNQRAAASGSGPTGSSATGATHQISVALAGNSSSGGHSSDAPAIVIAAVAGAVIAVLASGLFRRRRTGGLTK
jgi:hypothetical protein